MKYVFVLYTLAWSTAITCFGQEISRKNTVSLNFGPGFLMRQDLIFSPFIHKDHSLLNLGIDYTREANMFQKISLHYGYYNPMISDPYDFYVHGKPETAYPHSFNLVDMSYLIGKLVKEREKSIVTVGGLIAADIQVMNYAYGRISSLGYYAAFSPGIFGKYDLAVNKRSKVSALLSLPLFSWTARSPYLVNDDEFIENISSHSISKTFLAFIEDGNLLTWNRIQTFDLEMGYTCKINNRWSLGAAYWLEFIHLRQPRNLLSFRNSLKLSSTIRF